MDDKGSLGPIHHPLGCSNSTLCKIRKLRKKNCCAERLAEFGVDSLCMEWTAAAPVRILPVVFSQGGLSRDKQKQPQDTTGDSSCFIFHLYKGIVQALFWDKQIQTNINFASRRIHWWSPFQMNHQSKKKKKTTATTCIAATTTTTKNKNKQLQKKTTVSISKSHFRRRLLFQPLPIVKPRPLTVLGKLQGPSLHGDATAWRHSAVERADLPSGLVP